MEKPKDVGHFDFCTRASQNVVKRDLVARRESCGVANAFSTRLKLQIGQDPAWKPPKRPKSAFLQKAPGVNGLGGTRVHFYM